MMNNISILINFRFVLLCFSFRGEYINLRWWIFKFISNKHANCAHGYDDSIEMVNITNSPITHYIRNADNPSDTVSKLCNPSGVDVSYSTRHVEESWHHLMKSEDTAKFKQIAVCNFDFLLAAVSITNFISINTVRIQYLLRKFDEYWCLFRKFVVEIP